MRSSSRLKTFSIFAAFINVLSPETYATVSPGDEVALGTGIAPSYKTLAADPYYITDITSTPSLDSASIGTVTSGSEIYWVYDGTDAYCNAGLNNTWKTFKASSLTGTWSATTTVAFAETVRDGATSPGSPYQVNLILTKVGAAADLTRAQLMTFLRASTVKTWTAATAGTLLSTNGLVAGTTAIGWTAKAFASSDAGGTTPVACMLEPQETTLTIPVTSASGVAFSFTSSLINLHTWNTSTSSSDEKDMIATASGGKYVKFKVRPAKLTRSGTNMGIITSLLTKMNSGTMPSQLYQTGNSFANTPVLGMNEVSALIHTTSTPVKAKIGVEIAKIVEKSIIVAKFTALSATLDSAKYGYMGFGAADIASVTWSVLGTKVTATGTIGSASPKTFTCDLNAKEVHNTTTNPVLIFSAADGDCFYLKCFDATGLDFSADTSVSAGNRDDLLALAIKKLFDDGTVTTIPCKTFNGITALL